MFIKEYKGYYTSVLGSFKELIEVGDIFVTQLKQNLGACSEVCTSAGPDYYLMQKQEVGFRIFLVSSGVVCNAIVYQRKLNRTREQIRQDNEEKLMQAVQLVVSTLWEINMS
jgi:hypothetical protein